MRTGDVKFTRIVSSTSSGVITCTDPALGDGRVVHQHVEPAERVVDLEGQRRGGVGVAEVAHPHAAVGVMCRGTRASTSASRSAAPGDDADGRAAAREQRRERGADARRRAGDQDRRPLDLHAGDPT